MNEAVSIFIAVGQNVYVCINVYVPFLIVMFYEQ